MSEEQQPKKKIIKTHEVILVVASILLATYFIVGKYGCFLVSKAETEVQWTDGSSHDKLKRPTARKIPNEVDTETNETVRELALLFANQKGQPTAKTDSGMRRIGLTTDERDFYKNIRKNIGFEEEASSTQNWFTILKAAGSTYQTMQDIFQDEQPEDGDDFYKKLEKQFGIPSSLSAEFARQGKQKVSDWALFVEENQ